MWWQAIAAIIGLVLMAAPDVLGLPEPTGSFINILAPIATAFAIIATSEVTRGLRYAASLAAVAIAIGTVAFGAPMSSLAVVVVAAVVMAVLALGGGRTHGSYGGGWRTLA